MALATALETAARMHIDPAQLITDHGVAIIEALTAISDAAAPEQ